MIIHINSTFFIIFILSIIFIIIINILLLIMFVIRHDLGESQFLHYSSGIVCCCCCCCCCYYYYYYYYYCYFYHHHQFILCWQDVNILQLKYLHNRSYTNNGMLIKVNKLWLIWNNVKECKSYNNVNAIFFFQIRCKFRMR